MRIRKISHEENRKIRQELHESFKQAFACLSGYHNGKEKEEAEA